MILAAPTPTEHDAIARKVLDSPRQKNVKFNPNMIQWKVPEVKYIGHVLTSAGVHPDEDKVQALLELPTPQSRLELQRVLGVVNYLGRFITNMSTITTPLHQLLKKYAAWEWHGGHDAVYQLLKSAIVKCPVLKFFDPTKPALLQTDASSAGLGACLLLDGHPVAYAYRSRTPADPNYAQIEKELLGIVFGAECFI